jgi:cysteinyl-tRNA synthetase
MEKCHQCNRPLLQEEVGFVVGGRIACGSCHRVNQLFLAHQQRSQMTLFAVFAVAVVATLAGWHFYNITISQPTQRSLKDLSNSIAKLEQFVGKVGATVDQQSSVGATVQTDTAKLSQDQRSLSESISTLAETVASLASRLNASESVNQAALATIDRQLAAIQADLQKIAVQTSNQDLRLARMIDSVAADLDSLRNTVNYNASVANSNNLFRR